MARRIFLHVGAPKTGTTYLQSTLEENRALLAEHGLSYPSIRGEGHFEAAIDLLDHPWGGQLEAARGQWDDLASSASRASQDAVISHELLAAATPEQVKRARASLGRAEVHLVLTARDLARQIPAEWQETVKHRGTKRFSIFLRDLHNAERTASEEWFWRVQGLPDVLARWSAGLEPDHVHLVTVPPPGSPRELLWQRYAGVLGLPDGLSIVEGTQDNVSLGMVETMTLRLLNRELRGRSAVPPPVYNDLVRDVIGRDTFGRGSAMSPKITVPPSAREFVDGVTDEWLDWVEGSGIDVVGSLEDLRSLWPAPDALWLDPDAAQPEAMVEDALAALAALIRVEAKRRRRVARRSLRRRLGV